MLLLQLADGTAVDQKLQIALEMSARHYAYLMMMMMMMMIIMMMIQSYMAQSFHAIVACLVLPLKLADYYCRPKVANGSGNVR